ncbi:MAG: hypothetical protein QXD55_00575 [Candidatus Aenigmatarchaeota archaeon]
MLETIEFFTKTCKVLNILEESELEKSELLNRIRDLEEKELEYLSLIGFIKKTDSEGKILYSINENIKPIMSLKYLPFK